ncbi:MAG: aminoacyl-tRNA hydrolase [Gammaproteobacteria bacterium]
MASNSDNLVIVGLGNPGPKHAGDRHNVGFWFADQLAAHIGGRFAPEAKLQADECRGLVQGRNLRLIKPGTFMNRSGQSVRRVLDYYGTGIDQLLVVHDELDLAPGVARLKNGGGHGGHNGLRDILATCGPDFLRLRLGIGHPGHKDLVTDYVLHAPGKGERAQILDAMAAALVAIEVLAQSGLERAMQQLHSVTPRTDATGEFGPAG